jgi:MFS transporter, YNFM family, putative membrane transport protein
LALCAGTTVVFADMYATQPILPLLSRAFGVSPTQAGLTVSAVVLAIALASPFLGTLSDRFGRKRVIVASAYALAVASALCALMSSFGFLLAARLVQGFAVPGITAVGIAYLGDRVERSVHSQYIGLFVAANGAGGLVGRVLSGYIGGQFGWRTTFIVYGAVTLAVAIGLHATLRTGRTPRATEAPFGAVESHLRNPSLLGADLAGSAAFFSMTAVFTYLPYLLDRPPFSLRVEQSSLVYLSYAAGVIASILAGRLAMRRGVVGLMRLGVLMAAAGCLITLAPKLAAVSAGCIVLCSGMFFVQGLAPGYVNRMATHARATANSLYQSAYYLGAVFGALLPGFAYERAGWTAVIGVCIVAMALAYGGTQVMRKELAM